MLRCKTEEIKYVQRKQQHIPFYVMVYEELKPRIMQLKNKCCNAVIVLIPKKKKKQLNKITNSNTIVEIMMHDCAS